MKYYIAKFSIKDGCGKDINTPDVMQTARDLLTALSAEAGFESFEDTTEGCNGYVQTTLFNKELLDDMITAFPLEDITIEYEVDDAENKNWNKNWEDAGFEPIIINGKYIIHDTHHGVPEGCGDVTDITIEARQAFGTGTHETTRMIVRQLSGMNLTGMNVLDCGCGTGILSIVASKQGALNVFGYDIDEWSVENTSHNAMLNGTDNISVMLGDAGVLSDISEKYDVVLANINRNILLADMPSMRKVMKEQATLILSGFYKEDIPMLIEKAESLGMRQVSATEDNNWCMLVFVTADTQTA